MHCNSDGSSAKDGDVNTGYLVLLNHESSERASVAWGGDTIHVKPTAETTISLSQIEVRYLKNAKYGLIDFDCLLCQSRILFDFDPM